MDNYTDDELDDELERKRAAAAEMNKENEKSTSNYLQSLMGKDYGLTNNKTKKQSSDSGDDGSSDILSLVMSYFGS